MIDERNNPKLLIGLIGALLAAVVLVFAYQWFVRIQNTAPAHEDVLTRVPSATKIIDTTQDASIAADQVAKPVAPIQLIKEDVLKDDVPTDASLAKEEMAKLDDIQRQLNAQNTTLQQQHADADQLLKLKEEQIKALEAELAAQ